MPGIADSVTDSGKTGRRQGVYERARHGSQRVRQYVHWKTPGKRLCRFRNEPYYFFFYCCFSLVRTVRQIKSHRAVEIMLQFIQNK